MTSDAGSERAVVPDERSGQADRRRGQEQSGGEGPRRGHGAALPAQGRHDVAGALEAILGTPLEAAHDRRVPAGIGDDAQNGRMLVAISYITSPSA